MNTLEIWCKDINFEKVIINNWNINMIPREGEYIIIRKENKKIKQIIWDIDNSKIICVVV
jgi:hypothetical protein